MMDNYNPLGLPIVDVNPQHWLICATNLALPGEADRCNGSCILMGCKDFDRGRFRINPSKQMN